MYILFVILASTPSALTVASLTPRLLKLTEEKITDLREINIVTEAAGGGGGEREIIVLSACY